LRRQVQLWRKRIVYRFWGTAKGIFYNVFLYKFTALCGIMYNILYLTKQCNANFYNKFLVDVIWNFQRVPTYILCIVRLCKPHINFNVTGPRIQLGFEIYVSLQFLLSHFTNPPKCVMFYLTLITIAVKTNVMLKILIQIITVCLNIFI